MHLRQGKQRGKILLHSSPAQTQSQTKLAGAALGSSSTFSPTNPNNIFILNACPKLKGNSYGNPVMVIKATMTHHSPPQDWGERSHTMKFWGEYDLTNKLRALKDHGKFFILFHGFATVFDTTEHLPSLGPREPHSLSPLLEATSGSSSSSYLIELTCPRAWSLDVSSPPSTFTPSQSHSFNTV